MERSMPMKATSSSTTASTSPVCSARSMSPKTSSLTPSKGTHSTPANVSARVRLVLPAIAPTRRPCRSRAARHRVAGAHDDGLVEHRVRARVEEARSRSGVIAEPHQMPSHSPVRERAREIGPLAEDPVQLEAAAPRATARAAAGS